jgi:hypothetical protein
MADEGALSLLTDILIGDSHWTMAEVRRLIVLRERSASGRWPFGRADDDSPHAR